MDGIINEESECECNGSADAVGSPVDNVREYLCCWC